MSERDCQEGKRTRSLNSRQEEEDIDRELIGRGVRIEVEEGSKPVVEGVMRALRFWVMLSSMADLDIRRKSTYVS